MKVPGAETGLGGFGNSIIDAVDLVCISKKSAQDVVDYYTEVALGLLKNDKQEFDRLWFLMAADDGEAAIETRIDGLDMSVDEKKSLYYAVQVRYRMGQNFTNY